MDPSKLRDRCSAPLKRLLASLYIIRHHDKDGSCPVASCFPRCSSLSHRAHCGCLNAIKVHFAVLLMLLWEAKRGLDFAFRYHSLRRILHPKRCVNTRTHVNGEKECRCLSFPLSDHLLGLETAVMLKVIFHP